MVVFVASRYLFEVATYLDFPVWRYRFPIVIDMFPIEIFRSRYPVISNSFSRSTIPVPFPFSAKKTGSGIVRVFSRPLTSLGG
jgi:hypothetical protein